MTIPPPKMAVIWKEVLFLLKRRFFLKYQYFPSSQILLAVNKTVRERLTEK